MKRFIVGLILVNYLVNVAFAADVDQPDPCEVAASIVLNASYAASQPDRAVKISFRMQIINIDSIDPVTETVNVGFSLELSWIDRRIQYEATKCKMPIMVDRINGIWYPIFVVTNAADDMDFGSLKERSAIVDPTGRVTWPVFLYLSVSCKMDITYFPFDIQACNIGVANSLVFNSAYTNGLMKFMHDSSNDYSMDFISTPPRPTDPPRSAIQFQPDATSLSLWDVTGACTYSRVEELTGNIYFLFRIERKSAYYVVTLVLPTLVVSCLMATTFTADPADEEKLSIAVTGLLSYFFLLSTIFTQIPANSDTMPTLLYFYAYLLISGTVVTFLAAVIRNLATKAEIEESKRIENLARALNTISLVAYSTITLAVYLIFFVWLKMMQDSQRYSSLGAFKEDVCRPAPLEIAADA